MEKSERVSKIKALSSMVAVGKNECLTKGSKKGAKKKVADPISKKECCDVKVSTMFNRRHRKKLVIRTQETKIVSDGFKSHVFEVSLTDLQNDEVALEN